MSAAKTKPAPVAQGMTTMIMDITPAQATEFLRLNHANRPIRRSWVDRLTNIIERGEWMLTHQGIAITSDNRLLDGQHRLKAIVASGKTVKMNVAFDCDPETFTVIDGGVRRSISDQLDTPPMAVAVARLLWRLPRRTDNTPPTSIQVRELMGWAGPLVHEVMIVGKSRSTRTSAPVQAALVVHLMAGRTNVLDTFAAFRDLDFDAMPNSVKALTRQLMEGTATTSARGWDLMARTWRAFDPGNHGLMKIQLKDVTAACGEMLRVVEAYKRRNSKQA